MYQNLFKPVQVEKLNSLDSLKEKISKTEYQYEEVPTGKIELSNDGEIIFGNQHAPITLEGITHLVTRGFKIPNPFVNRIPFDLLQTNIKRLRTEIEPLTTLVLHDGIIINGIAGEYTQIPSLPLLASFDDANFDIKRIEHSHLGLSLQAISKELDFNSEPKEGDITRLGYNFDTSETGFVNPIINTLLYTLICDNGAILPKVFGQSRIKTNNRDIESGSLTVTFNNKIKRAIKNVNQIKYKLEEMNNIEIPFVKFNAIIKSAIKLTDSESVLSRLDLTSNDYSEIRAKAKDDDYKFDHTGIKYYTVYSELTNLANSFKSTTRKKLQKIAGKLLSEIK